MSEIYCTILTQKFFKIWSEVTINDNTKPIQRAAFDNNILIIISLQSQVVMDKFSFNPDISNDGLCFLCGH